MKKYLKQLKSLASYSGFKPEITELLNNVITDIENSGEPEATHWYIRCNSAEESSYAVVELTQQEYEAVTKFLTATTIVGGGYTGTCYIIDHSFESEDDAIHAILNY